jgi:hypothetical protein
MPVIAGGEDQHADDGPEDVGRRWRRGAAAAGAEGLGLADDDLVGDRAKHGLELLDGEEAQVGV